MPTVDSRRGVDDVLLVWKDVRPGESYCKLLPGNMIRREILTESEDKVLQLSSGRIITASRAEKIRIDPYYRGVPDILTPQELNRALEELQPYLDYELRAKVPEIVGEIGLLSTISIKRRVSDFIQEKTGLTTISEGNVVILRDSDTEFSMIFGNGVDQVELMRFGIKPYYGFRKRLGRWENIA